jgi:dolichol-phosphate mannosyltransferase
MRILIAIPTYNEFGNIKLLIQEILNQKLNADILFIDDNSEDGTQKVIKSFQNNFSNIKLISREKKMGVGSAHLEAIEYSYAKKYNILITMDADFTHNPKYIPEMIVNKDNYEMIIGSRHLKKDSIKSWPIFRKSLTYLAFFVTKNLLKINFDATSGFRLYNIDKINKTLFANIKSSSYSFFVETSYFLNQKITVKAIPIDMPIRFAEKSKMNLKDMSSTILLILRLFFKNIFFKIKS